MSKKPKLVQDFHREAEERMDEIERLEEIKARQEVRKRWKSPRPNPKYPDPEPDIDYLLNLLDRPVSGTSQGVARQIVAEWVNEDHTQHEADCRAWLGHRIATALDSARLAERERIREAVEKVINHGISDHNIDDVLKAVGK